MKKVLITIGVIIVVILIAAGLYFWRGYQTFLAVEAVQIDPQLTVYSGAGNSIVLTSSDGSTALVVDTKMSRAAEKLKSSVRAKEVFVVNTHAHADHAGGNGLYPQAKIIAGAYPKEQWEKEAGKDSRYPDITLKPGEEKELLIGDETVRVRNMGRAHTWNDVVVYLVRHKMLVTGDLVFVNMHPAMYAKSGASLPDWKRVLDLLARDFDIRLLVPGHGKVSDKSALTDMKNYFMSVEEALGDRNKLAALKAKYKNYYSIPGMISFDKVVQFMNEEKLK